MLGNEAFYDPAVAEEEVDGAPFDGAFVVVREVGVREGAEEEANELGESAHFFLVFMSYNEAITYRNKKQL